MQYRSNDVLIEFLSDRFFGQSEVRVNGQTVSEIRKMGKTIHDFKVTEAGREVAYRITRYLDASLGPVVDIIRAGKPVLIAEPVYDLVGIGVTKEAIEEIQENVRKKIVRSRSRSLLADYELKDAEAYLLEDAKLDPEIAETHFLLACVYSMTERSTEGFTALERAVALDDTMLNNILVADGLAYLRLQAAFAEFRNRHYLKK